MRKEQGWWGCSGSCLGLSFNCLSDFVWLGGRAKQGQRPFRGVRVSECIRGGVGGLRLRVRCGAGPLAYAEDALGLRRNERRWQGGCSNVFIGVSFIR